MKTRLAFLLLLASAPAAHAAGQRDYCPDRPGLDTPPCTMDPGHVSVEVGLADWTLDRTSDSRTDTILAGDTLVRLGLADHLEAQLGWTPFGHVRVRDRATGAVDRQSRVGDVTVALRRNLQNPDGSGISFALMPYATLPVGRSPVGAGDWGAGLLIPASFALTHSLSLAMTPEVDAAVDQDGDSRHLAYGSVIGLADKLSETIGVTAEFSAMRDEDPSGHATTTLAGLSVNWLARENLQLDLGGNAGLNHASPDVELYVGVSRRF